MLERIVGPDSLFAITHVHMEAFSPCHIDIHVQIISSAHIDPTQSPPSVHVYKFKISPRLTVYPEQHSLID